MKRLFFVYQLVLHLLGLPVVILWPLLAIKLKRIRPFWSERLGFWGKVPKGAVWLHGASMGEIRAILPLVEALKRDNIPIIITSLSDTGRVEAQKLVDGHGVARMIPLDFFWSLFPAFFKARPRALVVAETEIWPGFLLTAHFFGVPMILVSGRISDKTFASYRKMRSVTGKLLSLYKEIHAQSEKDAERFRQLGASAATVKTGGNMKFDACDEVSATPESALLQGARERGFRVLIAGSTHPGEAAAVAAAARMLKEKGHKIALVVAPRHLQKLDSALGELSREGFKPLLLSQTAAGGPVAVLKGFEEGRALVVDSMGVLNKLYAAADIAFVGGSLVPVGGHSLLEPLSAGVPVFFGPHMENSAQICEEAVSAAIGFEINSAEQFSIKADELLKSQQTLDDIRKISSGFLSARKGAVARAMYFLKGP